MKLFDFSVLDPLEQVSLLYQDGTYIGKRRDSGKKILLYQYGDFYVEIIYSHYRTYVEKIRCFESMALLDPYLDDLDIEVLIGREWKG